MTILFSDKKFFDIDDVSNTQNNRVWAVDHADVDKKGVIKQRQKVMVWLGACLPLIILDEGTIDHIVKCFPLHQNMRMKLLVAIESFNRMVLDTI